MYWGEGKMQYGEFGMISPTELAILDCTENWDSVWQARLDIVHQRPSTGRREWSRRILRTPH